MCIIAVVGAAPCQCFSPVSLYGFNTRSGCFLLGKAARLRRDPQMF
jgi:hypothetical protein